MSFHYYAVRQGDAVNFTDEQWYKMIDYAAKMQELIDRHYAVSVNYGISDRLPLVIDEWGCWHPDGSGPSNGYNLFEQQSTMRDAAVAALTLNIFNNNASKILMANVAQLCNNLHALFLSGGENLITTPTYHVFDMYKGHQGAECIRVLNGDSARLSVSASKKDGKILITAANLSLENDVELDIELLGASVDAKAVVKLLTADDVRAHNTFEKPDRVVPAESVANKDAVVIPRGSVAAIELTVV